MMPRVFVLAVAAVLSSCASASRVADPVPYGLFYNTTGFEIKLELFTTPEVEYMEMWIGPRGCNGAQVRDGGAIVHTLRGSGPPYERAEGKVLARSQIRLP